MTTQANKPRKAGFATIIGKPNVGKSTLMNRLIGQKIAITSYKPQTTRTQVRTILTEDRGQVVFLDTPGIHNTKTRMGEYMVKAAQSTLKEVDVVLWLVEPREKMSEEDKNIVKLLAEVKTPVLILINKIDSVKKAQILPVIALYQRAYDEAVKAQGKADEAAGKKPRETNLKGIIPVSARTGYGKDDLLESLFNLLPEGEPFYDEEQITTETEREIAGEIIREKALRLLQEEVPHGIAVTIDSMKDRTRRDGTQICDIDASIICERESHKLIVIGRQGAMLKKIGTAARTDIENMLQSKVNLKLWVKVRKDWKDNEQQMKSFGYDMRKYK
ncbi:MAG: GTPase Era [Lachnospiraceae bacterium]|nr:GTPase Era [Lachnospiraceae bacterium]